MMKSQGRIITLCILTCLNAFSDTVYAFQSRLLKNDANRQGTQHQPAARLPEVSGVREETPLSNSRLARSVELPPVLKDMVQERREYELKLGKAMDTLRKDYPQLLTKKPGRSLDHLNAVGIRTSLT